MAQRTPTEAHAQAVARIQAVKASGQTWLDLGDLDLEEIPADIACLDHLQILSLGKHQIADTSGSLRYEWDGDRATRLVDLQNLESLVGLKALSLSCCKCITDLSPLMSLTNLHSLSLDRCESITDFSSLEAMTDLKSLSLAVCENLTDLSPLRQLKSLQFLSLGWCPRVSDLSPIESLTSLQSLSLDWCKGIVDLKPLKPLNALRCLTLDWCSQITDFEVLEHLNTLQVLSVSGCTDFCDLNVLKSVTGLTTLNLDGCLNITDIGQLQTLTMLQSLSLERCGKISDLGALASLMRLTSLDLNGCESVTDISPLSCLSDLTSLNLSWCVGVSDIGPVKSLRSLKFLSLDWCKRITDLSPLTSLTALETLKLDRCEGVSELSPLTSLTELRSLTLTWCEGVTDISPLKSLKFLQSLRLCGCDKVNDISPLSALTDLQLLDLSCCTSVTDLGPLSSLCSLWSLGLSWCTSVTNLSPLSPLKALQTLDISGNTCVCDISPLSSLFALRALDLSDCRVKRSFSSILCLLPQLTQLILFGSEWTDIPISICGERLGDNVLFPVRAHFADLDSGKQTNAECKVMILGNGGVGKTQLARRLQGLPFDTTIPTTHGIELGGFTVSVDIVPELVNLHLWDFGGQDIYHGAHSLFLQREAIYLILWNPRYETGSQIEAGQEMPHRPLTYWLDFVRSIAGDDTPILIVQTQCDRSSERINSPPANLDGFRYVRILSCSAATGQGLRSVTAELEDALSDSLERRGLDEIGVGRVAVRQRLRELLAEDQARPRDNRQNHMLSIGQFTQICQQAGGVSDPLALLKFLHTTGVVYYRPEVMKDRLVLDQNWAFEGIYTLFHRQKTLPVLRKLGGKFSRADLECLIWGEFSVEEQELFLDVMQACGMCFPTRRIQHHEGMVQEFVAPDLLPENPESKYHILSHLITAADAEVEIQYPFLHEGILRSLLSEIGRHIGQDGVFWKYGCWFYEQRRGSEFVLDSARAPQPQANDYSGTLLLRAWKGAAAELMESVLKVVTSLNIGQMPTVRWLRGHPTTDLSRQRSPSLSSPVAESEPPVEAAVLPPLQGSSAPVQPAKSRPEVFISYAWGDEKTPEGIERQKTVDHLEAKLDEWGYKPIRDKRVLRNGDLLSAFMSRLAKGDRVLVILSGAYLKSEACMTEVNGLFKTADRDKTKFLKRIIPVVLSDANISRPGDRIAHAKYWDELKTEMYEGFNFLGAADKQRLCMISEWVQQIGDILAFISDELHPHGYERIIKNDFAAVRDLIARKVAGE